MHTGIGGYMPRYVTSLIEENSFSLTTMCQTPYFDDFYLAHFVLNEKSEPQEPAMEAEDWSGK